MKRSSGPLIRFSPNYFLLAVILLFIEMVIGVYVHDCFFRPYGGDFLVVILLYCFARACLNLRVIPVALAVLLFSWFFEWLQYLKLADHLSLGHRASVKLLLGNYFSWTDICCYTSGIIVVLAVEGIRMRGLV